jgi:hypothetical protein
MRLRCGAVTAALLGATCLATPARAQYADWRASVAVSGSYNRAITDQPYPTQLTFSGPSVALTPSLTLLADTPMTSENLAYNLSISLPFTSAFQLAYRPLQYSNHFTFTSRITINDLTSLSLNLGFIETPINGALTGGSSEEAPVDFIPAGVEYTLSGTAGLTLSRQITELFSVAESLNATIGAPFDPMSVRPRTMSGRTSTTLTRTLETGALGLTLNVAFNGTTAGQSQSGGITYPTQSLSNSLMASWTYKFREELTLTLGGGAAQTITFPNPGSFATQTPGTFVGVAQHWQPTGSVSLSYHRDLASVSLSYNHAQSVNLADGSNNFTDSVNLRFSLPAANTGITTSATAGFNHNQAVGGVTAAGTDSVFLADATIMYRPPRVPTLGISLRGMVSRQIGDVSIASEQSTSSAAAVLPISNLTRLGATLSLTFSYPDSSRVRSVPHLGPVVSTEAPEPEEILNPEPPHLELPAPDAEPEAPPPTP